MNKGIKILVGIMLSLAVISSAFLLFAKRAKPAPTQNNVTQQKDVPAVKNSTVTPSASNNLPVVDANSTSAGNLPAVDSVVPAEKASVVDPSTAIQAPAAKTVPASVVDRKVLNKTQWNQCKGKTLAKTTNLIWTVQITEGIPAKGTYAKGNLNGDVTLPVHVIIKSDSTAIDKIKNMLVVGKNAFLRGNCTDVATDGSVVLQAF